MAYTMPESQVGYSTDQQYPRHQDQRSGSDAVHHAQVAYEQAIYNATVEQNLSKYDPGRQLAPSTKVSYSPPTRPLPTAYQEQRSRSVDQGDQRNGGFNNNFTQTAQYDALTKLTGEAEQAQQQMVQARMDEETVRLSSQERKRTAQKLEIQRHVDMALKNHVVYQTNLASSPLYPGSHGIPSTPRPDMHHRTQSNPERKASSVPQSRNGSIDQSQDHASSHGFFSGAARKVSLALHVGRSNSVDETRSPKQAHAAPFKTPRSASNAGLKTVKVLCDQIALHLPIVTTTTTTEILAMAGAQLGEGFDQKRYVLVESFKEVGTERPLRYYERITDVLNSWDSDEQNDLLIQPFHRHWEYESLDLHHAPRIVPSDMSTPLYYSHRPESWHKWTFTLRADGHILMQKYKGGDSKTICQLSDFDVYVPTKRQLKKLGTPKEFCFAVKSQQKSVLFECSSNFVHFFCTSEQDVASEWYRAIHGWRSHYMVNVMGLGDDSAPLSARPSFSTAAQRNPSVAYANQRKDSEISRFIPGSQSITTYPEQHKTLELRGGPPTAYSRAIAPSYSRSGSVASSQSSSSRNPSLDHTAAGSPIIANGKIHDLRKGSLASTHGQQQSTQTPASQLENIHPAHRDTQPEPAPFASEYALSGQDYALRKESIASASRPEVNAFAATSTLELERELAVRKQSYTAAPTADMGRSSPYPPSWRKPSTASVSEETSPVQTTTNNMPAVTASPAFEWRFDPFTGQSLPEPSHSQTNSQTQSSNQGSIQGLRKGSSSSTSSSSSSYDRKGSNASSYSHGYGYGSHRKGSASSSISSHGYERKGSHASSRKGSRDERKGSHSALTGRRGSRDDRKGSTAKARKASAVKLHTSDVLCAW